jgi:hypothetical protein
VLNILAQGDVPLGSIFIKIPLAMGTLSHTGVLIWNFFSKFTNFLLNLNIIFGVGFFLKLIDLLT